MDTIDGMRTFVAVARLKSFTAGAKTLDMSTKLASKYVRQLEQHLGAQLFNRTTRSVSMTETGHAYLERCVPILDQIDELEGLVQARQSELAGMIRVTAPTAFGSLELINAMASFKRMHPKVSIDLHLSDQQIAVIEEGFDLAIRFGNLEDSSLMARRLLTMRLVVFASPQYLAEHGRPADAQALVSHNCLLQKTSSSPDHWRFNINGQPIVIRVSGSFQANSPRAIVQMAAGGIGIGMCPLYVVEPFLERGELELLFEDIEGTEFGLHAVYPPSRQLTARIRALIDHLAETYA